MKKALEAFHNVAKSIDTKVTSLRNEVHRKKADHAEAAERLRLAMIEDAAGTTQYTTAELTGLKQHAEGLASEIVTATERLEMISAGSRSESGKKEKLQSLLEDVRKAHKRELVSLNADIERIQQETRELRAQLTLKIREANIPYNRPVRSSVISINLNGVQGLII